MRHLTYETLKKLIKLYPDLKNMKIFVETGTYKGGTILPMAKFFPTLHTVEVCENAYNFCRQQATKKGIKNITFHLGDSAKVLPQIIPTLTAPTIYFLDGHVTQNNSGYTGKGVKDVPVLEELRAINDLDERACVIIVDDMRLFGHSSGKLTAGADWTKITLDTVLKQFDKDRVRAHFQDPDFDPKRKTAKPLENDRYMILLHPKKK